MMKRFIDGEPLNFDQAKIAGYAEFGIGLSLQVLGLVLIISFKDVEKYNAAIAATTCWIVGSFLLLRGFRWNDYTSPSYHWMITDKTK